jgi:hypothetical protein
MRKAAHTLPSTLRYARGQAKLGYFHSSPVGDWVLGISGITAFLSGSIVPWANCGLLRYLFLLGSS